MLNRYSSIQLFLPFLAGLLLWHSGVQRLPWWLVLGIAATCCAALFFLQKKSAYDLYIHKWQQGVLASTAVVCLSWLIPFAQRTAIQPHHYSNYVSDTCMLKCVALDAPVAKARSYKVELDVIGAQRHEQYVTTQGQLIVYFVQADSTPAIEPGTVLWVSAVLRTITKQGNPGEFDYAAYCKRKGIEHVVYVKPQHYSCTGSHYRSSTVFFASCKQWCLARVKQFVPHQAQLGVAEALLVGDRADIDAETWEAYQQTGIVHIIAISGMHLGIFYTQLLWLLCFIPWCRKHKKITIVFCLLTMWFFAAMIGMPPSVARAGVIYTCMALGELLNKKSNPYNLLMVSAFVLLSYQPNWLLDIGCLLSYAAILGILLFAKRIERKIYTEHMVLQKIVVLFSTTMCAQIFTLPMCLYYFHQFPVMLLVSNFLAIPVTFVVLYCLLAMLLFCWCVPVAKVLGIASCAAIAFLNKCIMWLSKLPFFNISGISISTAQYTLLMVAAALLSIAILHRKSKALLVGALCILAYWGLQVQRTYIASRQKVFCVLNSPRRSIVAAINGSEANFFTNKNLATTDQKNVLMPTQHFFSAQQINAIYCDSNAAYSLAVLNGNALLQLYKPCIVAPPAKIDYVVLAQNVLTKLQDVHNVFAPKLVIVDASNSMWKIQQWKKEAEDLHLQLFITTDSGAWIKAM